MLSDLMLALACATVTALLFVLSYAVSAAWEVFVDWLLPKRGE
jgi:hypothetical protein